MKGNATMKIKKYSAYKDSGIEWIGDIPEHWEVSKLKYITSIYNGNSLNDKEKSRYESYEVEDIPYLSSKDIDSDFLYADYNNGLRIPLKDLSKFKVAPKLSTLLCIEGGSAGRKVTYLTESVCFVNKLACFKNHKEVGGKYMFFSLLSSVFKSQFKLLMTGLIGGVSLSNLKNCNIPLPPLSEQKKIASFLEKKTAEIDKAIELKQKENELLKEHRQITINQAVTRGLNPDVPLKDSGIEWIGDIPEHWEVRKLKYLAKVNPTRNDRLIIKYINEDVVNLPMEKISEKWEVDQSLFASTRSLMSGLTYFEKNDILLAKITPCFENGKGAYLDQLKTEMGFGTTELHVIRSKDNTTQCFLSYVLRSYMFKELATINMIGTAGQKRVSSFFLSNYIFTYPPLSEQKEIAAYLEEVDKETNRLIELNHRAIEKLKEYKQVLIDQAVRGKICLV